MLKAFTVFFFCCCFVRKGNASARKIWCENNIEFDLVNPIKLQWSLSIPPDASYLLIIYYGSDKVATGNRDNFSLTKKGKRLFNDTDVTRNQTLFRFVINNPKLMPSLQELIKKRVYYSFLASLQIYKTVYAQETILKYSDGCAKCLRHGFEVSVAAGVFAATCVAAALFAMWIIREKIAKYFNCKYGQEKPLKRPNYPPPLTSMVIPKMDKIFPSKKEEAEKDETSDFHYNLEVKLGNQHNDTCNTKIDANVIHHDHKKELSNNDQKQHENDVNRALQDITIEISETETTNIESNDSIEKSCDGTSVLQENQLEIVTEVPTVSFEDAATNNYLQGDEHHCGTDENNASQEKLQSNGVQNVVLEDKLYEQKEEEIIEGNIIHREEIFC